MNGGAPGAVPPDEAVSLTPGGAEKDRDGRKTDGGEREGGGGVRAEWGIKMRK